jgi:hypothetical protein
MEPLELRELLAEWTDYDVAGFRLGSVVGVFPPDRTFSSVKSMFWMDGYPLGEMLVDTLDLMVTAGVLLKNDDEQRYKWNPVEPNLELTRGDIEAGRA